MIILKQREYQDPPAAPEDQKESSSEPNHPSSFSEIILDKWERTFSLEIRLLEGKGKFLLGTLIHVTAIATFLTLLSLALTTYSDTTYMSLSYTEYSHSDFSRSTTECSTVPVAVSSTLYVDENGVWSTDSKYNSFKMLKQVTFTNFEGDESDFDQAIEELNSCIDEINVYTSNHSFQSNLIYLGFTECQAANQTVTVSFPMTWNYIYDFSLYSVEANLALPNDRSWNNAVRTTNNASSFSGKVSMQVDSMLNLQITCAAGYTIHIPQPAKDYCSLLYSQLYGDTQVETEEKEVNIQLDLDSVARCSAINKVIVDANATDDLLVIDHSQTGAPYDNGSYYYAYLQEADNPTLMYVMPDYGYCVLVYEDEHQDIMFYPILEYTDDTCHSVFGPVSESCVEYEKTGCASEFGADIVLWMYDAKLAQNYGVIRMTAKGARQVLNSNLYYFEANANLSCQPLLTHLPTSSQEAVPVDLIENYYKCTTRAASSYSSALSEAWANTQLVLVCLALLISTILLRFFGNRLGQTLDYDDEAVEIAQLELALARVEEKKQLSLSLKTASMRGLCQDAEEGGGKAQTMGETVAPYSSMSSMGRKALSSVPDKYRCKAQGGQVVVHPAAAQSFGADELPPTGGIDVAAVLAQLAELQAEVGALKRQAAAQDGPRPVRGEAQASLKGQGTGCCGGCAAQLAELREEIQALKGQGAAPEMPKGQVIENGWSWGSSRRHKAAWGEEKR